MAGDSPIVLLALLCLERMLPTSWGKFKDIYRKMSPGTHPVKLAPTTDILPVHHLVRHVEYHPQLPLHLCGKQQWDVTLNAMARQNAIDPFYRYRHFH